MELNSGIHKVDGVRGANCYLVPAADGFYLIDTGMPGNAQKIIQYLKALGKNEKDLHMILLTHSDMDHSGSAAELKRRTGAKLAIHEGDAPSLSGAKELKKVKGVLGLLFRYHGEVHEVRESRCRRGLERRREGRTTDGNRNAGPHRRERQLFE